LPQLTKSASGVRKATRRLNMGEAKLYVSFRDWTKGREVATFGTNAGALKLPFQAWRHFKEAFAPEIVERAVLESRVPVRSCLDPFGGSGTTGLACQFLGIRPTLVEVNPFLADLIEAKLTSYDTNKLVRDLGRIVRLAAAPCDPKAWFQSAPRTFLEPGVNGRWIFDEVVGERIAAFAGAISRLKDPAHQRFFRVLLGGILIEASNVTVSGKGRRYRRGWEGRGHDASVIERLFCASARNAIAEVHRFGCRKQPSFTLCRGDARTTQYEREALDLAVFSPPYPNSFDYTDVYNVELWALGYLGAATDNTRLRTSTLCSHVQIDRAFPPAPKGSLLLDDTLAALGLQTEQLWDRRIPAMVAGYFADLMDVLGAVQDGLCAGGSAWMVVGDSRYAGVKINTAEILGHLSVHHGWMLQSCEPCRSMRLSPQQGGHHELSETLLVLQKC
jgi:hypothetical protein